MAKRATSSRPQTFDMAAFLSQVAPDGGSRHYRRNELIFKIGDRSDKVFYLQSGTVKIAVVSEQGKEAVVGLIQPHQFFGQSALGGEFIRSSTAVAMNGNVTAISLRKSVVLGLLAAHQDFANAFMLDLLDRNAVIEADLADQLFNSSEKRLARVLLTLAHYGTHREPQPILADISQETLAAKVGTTRNRINHFMNKFRRLGFISYNGHLEVNPSLLNAVLHEFEDDDKSATT